MNGLYHAYLIVVENPQDIEKIDKEIESSILEYRKLGKDTYLVFVSGSLGAIHTRLKKKLHISGKIHWIALPDAQVTDGLKDTF